jgi:hypothetical protein
MASLVLSGDTSGSITVSAPAVAGSTTQTLVNVTGTLAPIVSGTAVTCAGQTSIDFTGIPSWVKRITVMFSNVSTSGTSNLLVQIGAGSVATTGYSSVSTYSTGAGGSQATSTAGMILTDAAANASRAGMLTLANIGSNIWVANHSIGDTSNGSFFGGGSITLGGTLDRVRITTVNGTDTFDTTPSAGTINILYE